MQRLPGFTHHAPNGGITPRKPDKRRRLQFRFWMDVNNAIDDAIGEYLDGLKKRRKFTSTIRDAIRLIRDLRAGNTAVLCELFPWIADAFQPETPGDGMNALLQKIAADTEQLVAGVENGKYISHSEPEKSTIVDTSEPGKLKYISVSDPPEQSKMAEISVTSPGPRQMAVPQFAAPEPDNADDDTLLLAIRPDANAGKRAAANFVASTLAMCNSI